MEISADEIKRLQSCINNLISVLALPAPWGGSEPAQMIGILLDVLLAPPTFGKSARYLSRY
jgi:hypothetical protein